MEKLYHSKKSVPSASPVGAGGALGASYLVWERGWLDRTEADP